MDLEYIKSETKFGIPIIAFENLEQLFNPADTYFHVAIPYTNMNQLRADFVSRMKCKGFYPASYVSSKSFVWPNVKLGEHVFIFENNTIQPFVTIGKNSILWSGNHIGHHSVIEDNVFISSQVVLSGHCQIGNNSFIGVNATIANNIKIAEYNWLGMNVCIGKSSNPYEIFKSNLTVAHTKTVHGIFLK